MSKSIRSYPKSQQANVIARRRQSKANGLGYLSAISLRADMILNHQEPQFMLAGKPVKHMTNAEFGYPDLSPEPLEHKLGMEVFSRSL